MQMFIFDSYAWIGFFRKEPGYLQIANLLSLVEKGGAQFYTSGIKLGEVFYILKRKNGKELANYAIDYIKSTPVTIEVPNLKAILGAAYIKSENKLSFADAFAIQLCIDKKGILISDDPEIQKLKGSLGNQ